MQANSGTYLRPSGSGKYKAISVLDYDPTWPAQFEEIKIKLGGLLDGMVADIVHIGSTSVPGLCAKPKSMSMLS